MGALQTVTDVERAPAYASPDETEFGALPINVNIYIYMHEFWMQLLGSPTL